jgi:hypothetical protein
MVEERSATVTDVDMPNQAVNVTDQFGTKISVSLDYLGPVVVIPKAGEQWVIRRRGGNNWFLFHKRSLPVETNTLSPGDVIITGDNVMAPTPNSGDNSTKVATTEFVSAAGTHLDYQQIIVQATGITAISEDTAQAIITGNSVSFNGASVMVEFWAPYSFNTTNGAKHTFVLIRDFGTSDETILGQVGIVAPNAVTTIGVPNPHGILIDTPPAGLHVYSLRMFVSTGSGTVGAGPGGSGNVIPAFLRISKA